MNAHAAALFLDVKIVLIAYNEEFRAGLRV
jgi:hypothetical protein